MRGSERERGKEESASEAAAVVGGRHAAVHTLSRILEPARLQRITNYIPPSTLTIDTDTPEFPPHQTGLAIGAGVGSREDSQRSAAPQPSPSEFCMVAQTPAIKLLDLPPRESHKTLGERERGQY